MAVAFLDPEVVKRWATSKGLPIEDYPALLANEDLKKAVLEEMEAKAKELKLTSLEKIKHIHFTTTMFTVDNDLVTPTFKLKRHNARKFFAKELTELYAEPN